MDFRTGSDNRSASVKSFATKLGAAVSDRLNSEVKHVIIKDGSLANYKEALRLGLHIVSFCCLEGFRQAGEKHSETDHQTVSKEDDSPGLRPEIRKVQSMESQTVEEDFQSAKKSLNRKLKIRPASSSWRRRRSRNLRQRAELQLLPRLAGGLQPPWID